MRGVLGLAVELWTFGSPGGLQTSNFSKCWASPPHLAKVGLRQVFTEFGDSYTLLDVYNIFEKLKLAHAHYEASITFKALTSTSHANQIITFFFKG
jgi:hypothetical protein